MRRLRRPSLLALCVVSTALGLALPIAACVPAATPRLHSTSIEDPFSTPYGSTATSYTAEHDFVLSDGFIGGHVDARRVPLRRKRDPFDVFPVRLSAGERLDLQVDAATDANVRVALLAPGSSDVTGAVAAVLTKRSDPAVLTVSDTRRIDTRRESILHFVVPVTGVYQRVVFGSGSPRRSDEYAVNTTVDPRPNPADAQPPGVAASSPVSGALDPDVDPVDAYAVRLEAGQALVAWVYGGSPTLRLYAPADASGHITPIGAEQYQEAAYVATQTGVYSLVLRSRAIYPYPYELRWWLGRPSAVALRAREDTASRGVYVLTGRVADRLGHGIANRHVFAGVVGSESSRWEESTRTVTSGDGSFTCRVRQEIDGWFRVWCPSEGGWAPTWRDAAYAP